MKRRVLISMATALAIGIFAIIGTTTSRCYVDPSTISFLSKGILDDGTIRFSIHQEGPLAVPRIGINYTIVSNDTVLVRLTSVDEEKTDTMCFIATNGVFNIDVPSEYFHTDTKIVLCQGGNEINMGSVSISVWKKPRQIWKSVPINRGGPP